MFFIREIRGNVKKNKWIKLNEKVLQNPPYGIEGFFSITKNIRSEATEWINVNTE